MLGIGVLECMVRWGTCTLDCAKLRLALSLGMGLEDMLVPETLCVRLSLQDTCYSFLVSPSGEKMPRLFLVTGPLISALVREAEAGRSL